MKIYECPVCHRKFSESEISFKIYSDDNEHICCPKCSSYLIKSDNGEYIEYED